MVLIVKTVAPCVSNVVALHVSRRLKTYRRRARTNRTNNGRSAGRFLSRQRRITFHTKFVSTSQVHGCLRRLFPVLQALSQGFHGYSSGHARRACKRSLRGYGDLSRMEMQWNSTRGLLVFLLRPCSQKAWLMSMRKWKRRACCCMSWWRAQL